MLECSNELTMLDRCSRTYFASGKTYYDIKHLNLIIIVGTCCTLTVAVSSNARTNHARTPVTGGCSYTIHRNVITCSNARSNYVLALVTACSNARTLLFGGTLE